MDTTYKDAEYSDTPIDETEADNWLPWLTHIDSKEFLPTTVRYIGYDFAMMAGSAGMAIMLGVPIFHPLLAAVLSFGTLGMMLYYDRWCKDDTNALRWMLAFAGVTGLTLGPILAAIAATVPGGAFIIAAALITTVIQTLALFSYTWYTANYTDKQMNSFGAFLSMGLTGLIVLGLINCIFPTSGAILIQSVIGVAIFSGYLVYDFWKIKTGRFPTPVSAAVNVFLDIVNLFLDLLNIFLMVHSDSTDGMGQALSKVVWQLLPLLLVVGAVLSFGYLEDALTSGKTTPAGRRNFDGKNDNTDGQKGLQTDQKKSSDSSLSGSKFGGGSTLYPDESSPRGSKGRKADRAANDALPEKPEDNLFTGGLPT